MGSVEVRPATIGAQWLLAHHPDVRERHLTGPHPLPTRSIVAPGCRHGFRSTGTSDADQEPSDRRPSTRTPLGRQQQETLKRTETQPCPNHAAPKGRLPSVDPENKGGRDGTLSSTVTYWTYVITRHSSAQPAGRDGVGKFMHRCETAK